jgi:hypothetical protein
VGGHGRLPFRPGVGGVTLGRYVCGAGLRLFPSDLIRYADELPDAGAADCAWASLGRPVHCGLEAHDGPHVGMVTDDTHGRALWVRWEDGGRPLGLEWLPDCPETGFEPDGLDTACCHHLGHSGGHTWEVTDPEHDLWRAILPVLAELHDPPPS